MKIDILTLFPEMFRGPFDTSMLKKAQDEGLVEINIHNLRDWATDKHKTVDDRPYGGGPGMILRVDIIDRALKELKSEALSTKSKTNSKFQILKPKHHTPNNGHQTQVILLSAKGKTYNQQLAQRLSKLNHLILISGHYEGVDERAAKHLVDEEISVGDYILTGGEIPVMIIVDSVVRLIPGVLGNPQSLSEESFSPSNSHKLQATKTEYPQYTRPEVYRGWKVPKVLLSGNHFRIEEWRRKKAFEKTKLHRPDLLEKGQ